MAASDSVLISDGRRSDITLDAMGNVISTSGDDILLASRFNADPNFIPTGQELFAPDSYGFQSGLFPEAQSRGIATLPGGVPLFRDTNGDGIGDFLVGGIGVFFPGPEGFATYEQGFVAGAGVAMGLWSWGGVSTPDRAALTYRAKRPSSSWARRYRHDVRSDR